MKKAAGGAIAREIAIILPGSLLKNQGSFGIFFFCGSLLDGCDGFEGVTSRRVAALRHDRIRAPWSVAHSRACLH
ncbi:hypothetical protein [Nitrobacter hamburgensis]|uniref:hypothetical protein n=1 Tax=Nitrobacter hamburgensis TaxID=912 RepID=UPI000316FD03|nr:hypothetical protein [Nitrobacter hamburgensis]